MLRCRPTLPRPRLRASGRCPAGLSGAGRVPAGSVRRGPCCGSGRGRVAGKPGQHRSDRLALLLVKAAAGLSAQRPHLDGDPSRPWSRPSSPAAGLAGGALAGRWCGPRIWVGHGSLLARPATALYWRRRWPGGLGVSHRIPILSRSRGSGRPRAPCPGDLGASMTDDLAPRLHGEVALHMRAAAHPANPQHGSRPDKAAGSGRPARRAMPARRDCPAPTMVAQRFDHPSITDRSRGQRLVHRSITRHSAAPQRLNHEIPTGDTAAPADCTSHPGAEGNQLVPRPAPTPFGSLQNREPGQEHPVRSHAAAQLRPETCSAARQSDPWVRVAAPAGPAPPPASSGRPQARPASA